MNDKFLQTSDEVLLILNRIIKTETVPEIIKSVSSQILEIAQKKWNLNYNNILGIANLSVKKGYQGK